MSQVLRDISDAGQYAVGVEATADSPTLDPTALSIGGFAFAENNQAGVATRLLPNLGGDARSILFYRNKSSSVMAYEDPAAELTQTIDAGEAGITMFMGDGKWVGVPLKSSTVS